MSQPMATRAAVPSANSSAPSNAATRRSRPRWRPPSVRRATRSRRSFQSRTWWTSDRPSSHGTPTCLIELSGEAPVPPAPARGVDRREVRDQLGEVLDRVDVMVRWRTDVRAARLAAAEGCDVRGRLLRRQLAALAGLGSLGNLDL